MIQSRVDKEKNNILDEERNDRSAMRACVYTGFLHVRGVVVVVFQRISSTKRDALSYKSTLFFTNVNHAIAICDKTLAGIKLRYPIATNKAVTCSLYVKRMLYLVGGQVKNLIMTHHQLEFDKIKLTAKPV